MGFLELRSQCGVSHEVRQGAQGASLMAPGKSGLHVRGEGVRVISIEPWKHETRLVAGVISYNEVLLEKGGPLSPCDDRVLTKVGSLGTDARRENAAR